MSGSAHDPRRLTRRHLLSAGVAAGTALAAASRPSAAAASPLAQRAPAAASGPARTASGLPTGAAAEAVKTRPTYYTDAKRVAARANIEAYPWARTLRDNAVAGAAPFADAEDAWLWNLVTTQGLPRSYAVNQQLGSPLTGQEIYQYGNYPWLTDPFTTPYKLRDPSSDYVFPTNDFAAFYASGLDEHGEFDVARGDRSLLVNELYPERGPTWGVDDGFGWIDDNGDKWTFVAYYNHWWTWHANKGTLYQGLGDLQNAYVYTGDQRYAHAGLILLDRIADVYPSMDTAPYPREEGYLHSDGLTGRGKVIGSIWETGLARTFLSAYDAFFPALVDGDPADVVPFLSAQARAYGLPAKDTVEAIRANIEHGLLRQIDPAVRSARIRGNFGMHQSTLAMAAVVLDDPAASREWIDFVFAAGGMVSTPEYAVTGGNVYATLVDEVDRDGFGDEGAPGYNSLWLGHIRGIADVLAGYDGYPAADLYEHPKVRKLLSSRHPLVLLNRYTPTIGDSGTTGGPQLLGTVADYVNAFEKYGLPEYAQMAYLLAGGDVSVLYSGIFGTDVPGTQQRIRQVIEERGPLRLPSQLLAGVGFAALRDGDGDAMRALWTSFGRTSGHGHLDALNLGLHAHGVDLAPDHGYPEFADNNIRRREWTSNTAAHNTIVVDATPQRAQWVGRPHAFGVGERVQVMDVSAPDAYPQTTEYRRVSALVRVDDTHSYAVDVVRVVGGGQHHFSFHGGEGPATAEGLDLVAQPTGTYAGPDVDVPPDDAAPRPGASGFDWLTNVSRATPTGPFSVDWAVADTWDVHDPDPDLHLRLTMLSAADEVALCDGTPPRNKPGNPASLRYLLARRAGTELASQFVSVLEPYVGSRVVADIATVPVEVMRGRLAPHDVAAVRVTLTDGRVDYVVSCADADALVRVDRRIVFSGAFGVLTERDGAPVYGYTHGASRLGPRRELDGPSEVTGTVRDFTRDLAAANTLTVALDDPRVAPVDLAELAGLYVDATPVEWPGRNAFYRIEAARAGADGEVVLNLGDVTTVRGYVDPEDIDAGYTYDLAAGAPVRIALTREWTA